MAGFILSGFGDEIDPALDVQMEVLAGLDIWHIEARGVDGKNIADFTPEEAARLYTRLRARGFALSALGSPIGKIGVEEPFEPHLKQFRNLIEVARELHCPYIRLFSFFVPEGRAGAYQGEVLRRMEQLVAANQGSGVTLLHENEKHIYGDVPSRCQELLAAFPGQLYATYDPSNFVQCGVDNRQAFPMLAPYIRYLHVKDSVYTDGKPALDHGFEGVSDAHRPAGQGDGCLPYIVSELARGGYTGFASIEPHLTNNAAIPGSGADKFTVAVRAFRGLVAQLEA